MYARPSNMPAHVVTRLGPQNSVATVALGKGKGEWGVDMVPCTHSSTLLPTTNNGIGMGTDTCSKLYSLQSPEQLRYVVFQRRGK